MANTLTFANQTLTDANIYDGISFLADLNTGEELSIGNTASASVKFVTDEQLPLYTKDNTNGTFTWTRDNVSRGRYYITEVTKNGDRYTVTAYDAMILLDTNISALAPTFPLTVSAAASAIAAYIGCTVSGTVNNGSLSVESLDSTLTIRKLLGYVAEASGCSVKIDGSDHLCFVYYDYSGITVTASQYKTLDVADYMCAKIDKLVIYNSRGAAQATAGTGTNTLYIQGNPFLEEATNTNATNIFNQVKNFQYTPLRCEMFEENGLEIGKVATFGSTASLVMHIETSATGVIASSVGSDNRAEYNKTIEQMFTEIEAGVNDAISTANDAHTIAANTGQYFWYTGTGSDTGAHITEVTRDEFLNNPSGGNLLARSTGIAVRKGMSEVAQFSDSQITLGNTVGGHATFTASSIRFYPSYGSSDFNYARQSNVSITQTYIGDGSTQVFDLFRYSGSVSVTINGTATTAFTTLLPQNDSLGSLRFTSAPAAGAVIEATYTTDWENPYYDFGINTVSAPYGHAEGRGNTVDGIFGHAEGRDNNAGGAYSHAQNHGTKASGEAQTAMGKYNVEDTSNAYAVVVGNGNATTPSNAVALDWNGNLRIKGDIYAGCANDSTGGLIIPRTVIKQVAANGTTTISSQNARYTLTLIGGGSNYRGMYIVAGYNISVETKAIAAVGSGVISTSGANVVINNNENYAMIVIATVYVGSVTMS